MPIGPWELLIILFFVLLLFGARRLPEMGRSLGTGMRGFKEGITGRDENAAELKEPGASSERSADAGAKTRVPT